MNLSSQPSAAGSRPYTIIVLPGDGIGKEVTAAAVRVLEWFAGKRDIKLDLRHELFGAEAYHATGHFIKEEVFADLLNVDAVLFGAFGGTLEANPIPADIRRKFGLLRIRQAMQLFANVRPVKALASLAQASPLQPHVSKGADLVVIRELIGGIYFGEPRGITELPNGERRGVNTQVYTSSEIARIADFAFELAARRRKHVTSVDKSNVMESGALWREVVRERHRDYPDIELAHLYVDACAAELIMRPSKFDVILSDNLFGDILSDAASAITGSLGMLPSASFGAEHRPGVRRAFYEPVHGSAPDIAGKGIANPCGAILSVAMALEATFNRAADARLLEHAVDLALQRARTRDLADAALPTVSTEAFTDEVIKVLGEEDGAFQ
ncbi:MAG: 3-isopropylmalate dehydrogenase [Burkholderiaceae bacterium]